MKKAVHFVATLAIVGSFGLGIAALMSTAARAIDNPCDPTYQMLKQCKAQHGRWDVTCCCCRLH